MTKERNCNFIYWHGGNMFASLLSIYCFNNFHVPLFDLLILVSSWRECWR